MDDKGNVSMIFWLQKDDWLKSLLGDLPWICYMFLLQLLVKEKRNKKDMLTSQFW